MPVPEIVAEFVGENEVDASGDRQSMVIDDAPLGFALAVAEQPAFEPTERLTFHHGDWIGEAPLRYSSAKLLTSTGNRSGPST